MDRAEHYSNENPTKRFQLKLSMFTSPDAGKGEKTNISYIFLVDAQSHIFIIMWVVVCLPFKELEWVTTDPHIRWTAFTATKMETEWGINMSEKINSDLLLGKSRPKMICIEAQI